MPYLETSKFQSMALPCLLLLFSTVPFIQAEPLNDNSPSCTCYAVTSDTTPTYFLHHRFYDFRYFAANSSTNFLTAPPTVTRAGGTELTPDQDALNSTSWTDDWGIMNWAKPSASDAPVMMQNSPGNVYISQTNSTDLKSSDPNASTYLTLRTTRLPTFQSSAEVENEQKNMMYATIRFRARVTGAAGACAGMFTFFDDSNESDVEILTRDPPTTYRYTNQPSVDKAGNDVPAASQSPTNLPAWTDWHTHRIDWLKGMSRWYVDDVLFATNTYSVPRKPSGLIINVWSDGGVWTGNMSVGDSAKLDIQWIEVAFNTSGKRQGPGKHRGGNKRRDLFEMDREGHGLEKRKSKRCSTVCQIDDVAQQGFPEVTYSAIAGRTTHALGAWALLALTVLVSTLVALH